MAEGYRLSDLFRDANKEIAETIWWPATASDSEFEGMLDRIGNAPGTCVKILGLHWISFALLSLSQIRVLENSGAAWTFKGRGRSLGFHRFC